MRVVIPRRQPRRHADDLVLIEARNPRTRDGFHPVDPHPKLQPVRGADLFIDGSHLVQEAREHFGMLAPRALEPSGKLITPSDESRMRRRSTLLLDPLGRAHKLLAEPIP